MKDLEIPLYMHTEWLSRDSASVAPDLIGCTLVRQMSDGTTLRGLIVETEAYGPGDPAMHAYRRPTARNQVMFGSAGMAYVYLIYGTYHCFNITTDQPHPMRDLITHLAANRFLYRLDKHLNLSLFWV
jgi:DNA-3-methyladenine glycosylase